MGDDILLITIDCLRADHLSCYGYERQTTPNIDHLSNESCRYERAFSNGPGTRFAFRSLLGGVYPLRLDGAGLPDTEGRTLPEALAEEGYQTGGFVNNPFLTEYFRYNRGFDTFLDATYWTNEGESSAQLLGRVNQVAKKVSGRLSDGPLYRALKRVYSKFVQQVEKQGKQVGTSDRDVIESAIQWWESAAGSGPRFMWVHCMGVHHPYSYQPERRDELGIDEDVPHVRNPTNIITEGEEPPQSVIDAYDANIRNTDAEVGRLLEKASDATVMLTADHGEEFGTHGPFHQASTYDSMASVPLLIRDETVGTGESTDLVSHVDIPPVITSLVGIDQPDDWDGKYILTEERERAYLGFERPAEIQGAVLEGEWKYISSWTTSETLESEFLFNRSTDPAETESKIKSNTELAAELRNHWEDHFEEVREKRLQSIRPMWDAEKSLGDTVSRDTDNDVERDIDEQLEYLGYK